MDIGNAAQTRSTGCFPIKSKVTMILCFCTIFVSQLALPVNKRSHKQRKYHHIPGRWSMELSTPAFHSPSQDGIGPYAPPYLSLTLPAHRFLWQMTCTLKNVSKRNPRKFSFVLYILNHLPVFITSSLPRGLYHRVFMYLPPKFTLIIFLIGCEVSLDFHIYPITLINPLSCSVLPFSICSFSNIPPFL